MSGAVRFGEDSYSPFVVWFSVVQCGAVWLGKVRIHFHIHLVRSGGVVSS